MLSETVRYLATGGLGATLCTGIVRLVALRMRTNFNRHVVDRAFEQGQPIDPTEIINAATSRTQYQRPAKVVVAFPEQHAHRQPVLEGQAGTTASRQQLTGTSQPGPVPAIHAPPERRSACSARKAARKPEGTGGGSSG